MKAFFKKYVICFVSKLKKLCHMHFLIQEVFVQGVFLYQYFFYKKLWIKIKMYIRSHPLPQRQYHFYNKIIFGNMFLQHLELCLCFVPLFLSLPEETVPLASENGISITCLLKLLHCSVIRDCCVGQKHFAKQCLCNKLQPLYPLEMERHINSQGNSLK